MCEMGERSNTYKFKPLQYTRISSRNSKPTPKKWEHFQAIADSKNIYVQGDFRNIERFNFVTRKWTKYINSQELPVHVYCRATALNNDFFMIYGGFGPYDCSNELFIYDRISADPVQILCEPCTGPTVTTGEPPLARFGQVVYHSGFLYVVGGKTEEGNRRKCDVHRIDLETLVWENMYVRERDGEYEPQVRCFHLLVCDGKNIFKLGGIGEGGDGGMGRPIGFREVSIFNIQKKKWTQRNTTGDYDITCNDGYPIDTGDSEEYFDIYLSDNDTELKLYTRRRYDDNVIIWKLDLEMFQWTQITVLSTPSDIIASAISPDGSKHYVIRGRDPESRRIADIFVTWLEVPKLSDMCWEAVLHYLKVFDEKELVRAGVPLRYVDSTCC